MLKECSATLTHKSELGLVRLGVGGADEVAAAYDEIDAVLRRHDPAPSGVLVARMGRSRRELLVGGRHDPVFGPVVVVGDGGIFVEAIADVQVLLPPFGTEDVLAALDRLRVAPILHGARGHPPMDLPAVARVAVAVGDLLGDVVSVDLNPVLVDTAGCVAADAVVVVRSDDAAPRDATAF